MSGRFKTYLCYLLLLPVICFHIFFMTYKVEGHSMFPTLEPGKIGLAARNIGKLDRFDVVIVKTDRLIIKRVIGLPNESIEVKDNKLYINGKETEDQFANGKTADFKLQTKDKEYVVLGDNRQNSMDSRIFGVVEKSQIKGKILR